MFLRVPEKGKSGHSALRAPFRSSAERLAAGRQMLGFFAALQNDKMTNSKSRFPSGMTNRRE